MAGRGGASSSEVKWPSAWGALKGSAWIGSFEAEVPFGGLEGRVLWCLGGEVTDPGA